MAARRAASSVLSRYLLARSSASSPAGKSALLGPGDDLFMRLGSFLVHFKFSPRGLDRSSGVWSDE